MLARSAYKPARNINFLAINREKITCKHLQAACKVCLQGLKNRCHVKITRNGSFFYFIMDSLCMVNYRQWMYYHFYRLFWVDIEVCLILFLLALQ